MLRKLDDICIFINVFSKGFFSKNYNVVETGSISIISGHFTFINYFDIQSQNILSSKSKLSRGIWLHPVPLYMYMYRILCYSPLSEAYNTLYRFILKTGTAKGS